MQNMIKATDTMPLNFGFTGKGNDSGTNSLRDIIEAGACGLKVHEDWGATPEVIDRALTIADEYDVQVSCLSRWLDRCILIITTCIVGQPPQRYPQ